MDEFDPIKGTLADWGALGICLSAALGLIWYLVRLVKMAFMKLSSLADRMLTWLNVHNKSMDENTRAHNRLSEKIDAALRRKD